MEYPPYVKLLFFFSKRDDISLEQFHHHWGTIHADMVLKSKPFLANAKRYVQFHMLEDQKDKVKELNVPLLEHDGVSEFYVKNVDDWKKFWYSDDYQKTLADDAALWLKGPIKVMVGFEHVVYGSDLEI